MNELCETEVISKACRGDRRSFEKLVERYLPVILGFFCYLGASRIEAEDLAQETFIRVLKALDQYDHSRAFLKWITAIGRNVFIDHWRKTRRQNEIPMDMSQNPVVTVESTEKEYGTVEELLLSLSDDARYLVEMHVVEGLSFPEISESTGEAEGTLRVRFHRVLKRLRVSAKKGKTA